MSSGGKKKTQKGPDRIAGSLALKTWALDGEIIVTDVHLLRALRKQRIVIGGKKEKGKETASSESTTPKR